MSDAVTTQVGYGRNKGDGSDTQNLQPADEMHRYADQSDSFCNKALFKGKVMYRNNGAPLVGQEAEKYVKVLNDNANTMFEKAPAVFNSCLNALMEKNQVFCGIAENNKCFYNPMFNTVYMADEFYENNGSPYEDFWSVLLHEYSHAIDANLGGSDQFGYSTHASNGVRLKSTGGKTILECAIEELGDLHGEFDELVSDSDPAKEKKREFDELINEKDTLTDAQDLVAKHIASRIGKNWEEVAVELSLLGVDLAGSYEDAQFVSQFMDDGPFKDAFLAYFKDGSYSDVRNKFIEEKKKSDERNKRIEGKLKEIEDARFASVVSLSKEFLDLNDIMSAVSNGVGNKILGEGHGKEYFSSNDKRATEIFANIGPILAKDGKAAKWLKEKAPKLVNGYFELLSLGTERFRNKKEGV